MTYDEHYNICQLQYSNKTTDTVANMEVLVNPFQTPPEYQTLVSSLSKKVHKDFLDIKNPTLDLKNHSLSHKNPFVYKEVKQIINLLYSDISSRIFNCHFTTNKISLYKTFYSNLSLENTWQWHYDNNPAPHIKLFVYLTDVDKNTAPFVYLRNDDVGCVKFASSKISPNTQRQPFFPNSRIPSSFLEQKREEKYYLEDVSGKLGTFFIFDPNIVHKATIPCRDHSRIALAYHLHPVSRKTGKFYNFNDRDVKLYELY